MPVQITPPIVSAIMPAYNAEKYIIEAINSILNQSYKNYEVIVIDDGSSDDTLLKLEELKNKIKLIHSPHLGASNARNVGIEQAQGQYIAFLDADDIWHQDKLKYQVAAFENDPELDLCYTMFNNFLSADVADELKKTRPLIEGPIKGCVLGTSMIKKSSFDKVGGFDNKFKLGEFIDWYAKAMDLGMKVKFIEKDLYNRRSHADNQTVKQKDSMSDYVKVLKAKIDRNRK